MIYNFHVFLDSWIHDKKGNKEAGIICFEVRIPRLKTETIPSKIDV